jgi:hypothetical protein
MKWVDTDLLLELADGVRPLGLGSNSLLGAECKLAKALRPVEAVIDRDCGNFQTVTE